MEWLGRLVRLVFWVAVLSWALRLVGRLAGWALRRAVRPEGQPGEGYATESVPGRSGPQGFGRRLVRDPVCGMYLAETLAIPYREGGELVHFCSAECRTKYAAGSLRRAANG
jgi:YHS domain-containing protein